MGSRLIGSQFFSAFQRGGRGLSRLIGSQETERSARGELGWGGVSEIGSTTTYGVGKDTYL